MIVSRKTRIYPNKELIKEINKGFGCNRFIWNNILGKLNKDYEEYKNGTRTDKPIINRKKINEELKNLKIDNPWLYEASGVAEQQVALDLLSAFLNFFNGRGGFPKFKKKGHNDSYRVVGVSSVRIRNKTVILPKTNSPIKINNNLHLNDPSSYTVTRDNVGDYFISFVDEIPEIPQEPESKGKFVGIDLGIKSLAVIKHLNGKVEEIQNPQFYRKAEKRLKILQRRLSKKKKGSNNRNKARIRLAKCSRKITNKRNDFLHKLSARLITENQGINIEDLNVKGMLRNHNLAKSIQDSSFGILRQQLIYKAKRYIKPKVICLVHRFYPSTQICSHCGIKSEVKIKLHVREWTCGHCGVKHDRDINAATNILNEGLRLTQTS